MVMNSLYHDMAIKLNDQENHQHDSSYYNALVTKLSVFQFFNNYSSLFYIAFAKKPIEGECDFNDDCMADIGFLLFVTFIAEESSKKVSEIVLPRVKTRWRQYKEGIMDESRRGVVKPSAAENQWVLEPYDPIVDLLDDYQTMCQQFGYIALFVSSLPILPVVAFFANILEIQVDGHKLLYEYRFPTPESAPNI